MTTLIADDCDAIRERMAEIAEEADLDAAVSAANAEYNAVGTDTFSESSAVGSYETCLATTAIELSDTDIDVTQLPATT